MVRRATCQKPPRTGRQTRRCRSSTRPSAGSCARQPIARRRRLRSSRAARTQRPAELDVRRAAHRRRTRGSRSARALRAGRARGRLGEQHSRVGAARVRRGAGRVDARHRQPREPRRRARARARAFRRGRALPGRRVPRQPDGCDRREAAGPPAQAAGDGVLRRLGALLRARRLGPPAAGRRSRRSRADPLHIGDNRPPQGRRPPPPRADEQRPLRTARARRPRRRRRRQPDAALPRRRRRDVHPRDRAVALDARADAALRPNASARADRDLPRGGVRRRPDDAPRHAGAPGLRPARPLLGPLRALGRRARRARPRAQDRDWARHPVRDHVRADRGELLDHVHPSRRGRAGRPRRDAGAPAAPDGGQGRRPGDRRDRPARDDRRDLRAGTS